MTLIRTLLNGQNYFISMLYEYTVKSKLIKVKVFSSTWVDK